jgi:D-glycero-alpha-D-manno-heptose 1-phosphate guanylyltransferase
LLESSSGAAVAEIRPEVHIVSDLSTLAAAILVGGLGTRLQSRVHDRPKVLAEVLGRPFLAYLLDQLASAGIQHATLCTGHMAGMVKDTFGQAHGGMQLAYSPEKSLLGTGGALRLALAQLRSDPVLVLNGDSYCQADLAGFAGFYQSKRAGAAIMLTEVADTTRFGRVTLDDQNAIIQFEEKGSAVGVGWINAGLYLLSQHVLNEIPQGRAVSLEREVFPSWLGRGLYGWRGGEQFIDIGTPDSYAEAASFFAAR